MSYARQMLNTYPHHSRIDAGVLAAAIDALDDCVQACTADVDADLSESDLADMVKCIRLCVHCTDVCAATRGVVSRPAEYDANVTKPLVEACVAICKSCGDECERHAQRRHLAMNGEDSGSPRRDQRSMPVAWPTSIRWPSGSRTYARISRPWSFGSVRNTAPFADQSL